MGNQKNSFVGGMVVCALALSACGGSSGGSIPSVPGVSSVPLNGVVAAGAPLIGQVTVKGAQGNTKSAYIEMDGHYSVDVDGLTAPYRLRAVGSAGGKVYRLHAYAEAADVNGNVNITPFTDLIIANAAQQIAADFFDSTTTTLDTAVVDAQETALQAKLQNVFDVLGISVAIDLLTSTFSTNHSGLDAALDLIRIETNTATNIATITSVIEPGNQIVDDILDADDNSEILAVTDGRALTTAVSDTQAIMAVLDAFIAPFANGLPTVASVQDYLSTDFYAKDKNKDAFLHSVMSDSTTVGSTFHGAMVSDLDSTLKTAKITFNFGRYGVAALKEQAVWFVAKESLSGQWQLRGDQRIIGTRFEFYCNDIDGPESGAGTCGISTLLWDTDVSNNGTVSNTAIASATISVLDGSNPAQIKSIIYFGKHATAPADFQVFNEQVGDFYGDTKGFGTTIGLIDSSLFNAGDIVQLDVYTQALDISTPSAPQIASGAVAVESYQDALLFAPSLLMKLPTATPATIGAINNFSLGNNLNVAWDLANGTQNLSVLVSLSDSQRNRIRANWNTLGTRATNVNIASSLLSPTVVAEGLDENAQTYELLVRIFAQDGITGQTYSRDYKSTIPGPRFGTALPCDFDTGWDSDNNKPASFKNYNNYLSVVNVCGGIQPIDANVIIGTWDSTWPYFGTNTIVINANGTLSYDQSFEQSANPPRINGTWRIIDNIVTLNFGEFTEAWAFYPGGMKVYTEGTSWGSDGVFNVGADGHVWTSNYVKQ